MIRVGCQYETTKCGPVTVIEQLSDYYYRVRFHKTGTEKAFRQDAIKRGEIKDPYAPLRCGVGITGDFYTKEKNAQINVHMQDIQMKPFIAIDPNGNKYHSDNITEFARQHEGLTRRHISGILHGRAKTTAGGWKFFYEEMT